MTLIFQPFSHTHTLPKFAEGCSRVQLIAIGAEQYLLVGIGCRRARGS